MCTHITAQRVCIPSVRCMRLCKSNIANPFGRVRLFYATQLWLRCHSSFCDRRGVNVQPLLERVSYLETELESYVVLRVPAVAPFSLGRPSLCALALCSPRSERACVQLENRDLKLQLNEALRYATRPNRV